MVRMDVKLINQKQELVNQLFFWNQIIILDLLLILCGWMIKKSWGKRTFMMTNIKHCRKMNYFNPCKALYVQICPPKIETNLIQHKYKFPVKYDRKRQWYPDLKKSKNTDPQTKVPWFSWNMTPLTLIVKLWREHWQDVEGFQAFHRAYRAQHCEAFPHSFINLPWRFLLCTKNSSTIRYKSQTMDINAECLSSIDITFFQ